MITETCPGVMNPSMRDAPSSTAFIAGTTCGQDGEVGETPLAGLQHDRGGARRRGLKLRPRTTSPGSREASERVQRRIDDASSAPPRNVPRPAMSKAFLRIMSPNEHARLRAAGKQNAPMSRWEDSQDTRNDTARRCGEANEARPDA